MDEDYNYEKMEVAMMDIEKMTKPMELEDFFTQIRTYMKENELMIKPMDVDDIIIVMELLMLDNELMINSKVEAKKPGRMVLSL